MTEPPISIIIPCYNQGKYLEDALASLAKGDNNLFEIIIVNDGSTEEFTNQYLNTLKGQGVNVIFQQNLGLGAARNTGIKNARENTYCPLDADNKISPEYVTESLAIFESKPEVAVVYGNANYFGDKTGILKPGPFNLQRLMLGNYIDACAAIRKSVLDKIGLYDNMKIMGYEDWDLWLRIAFGNYKFFYVDKVLFDYRVTSNSMMRTLNEDIQRQNEIEKYFEEKYHDKLSFKFAHNHFVYKMKKHPLRFFYRLFLQKYFPSYYNKLKKENKMYQVIYMIESEKYTDDFFDELEVNSHKSAKVVLPILSQVFQPKSVIDVGCGTGTWLKVWDEDLGVKDYLGIEGPYVKPEMLKIPVEKVQFKDLKKAFDPGRKFDLAMSLEVAEHLPVDYSREFIQRLTALSDIILFSAAIPHQEGTYHINEQYPEFWAKHFEAFDYVPVDYMRPRIWNHAQVEYWYQQNIILFVKKDVLHKFPELANIAKFTNPGYLTRIHPFLYELKTRHIKNTKSIFGYLNWKWYVLKLNT